MNSGLITGLIAGPNRLSKAVLSRKQSIPNAEIVQALQNLDINATAGIITTLPQTTSTLAALETAQTFTLDNVFASATASTSTSSGAVKIAGGLGVFGAGYFASLNCQNGEILALSAVIGITGLTNAGATTLSSTLSITLDTNATSSTAGGAVTISGGLAVAKKAFIGTLLDLVATTATAGQITQGGERFIHTFQPSGQQQNVFIGFQAGRTSTMSGGGNVGIGRAVLQGLTSGENNLCFGDGTAFTLTAGNSNIIIGQAAGNSITTGSTNCAVGVNSLSSLTITSDNCAFGHQALGSQTGTQNVGVGKNAGFYSTSNNGTYIGQTAGIATATVGGLGGAQITSGANCTMLGQASSSTSATGNYRTAIGSDSRCQSDNAIKLGRDTLDKVIIPSWATAPTTSLSAGMLYYDTTLAKLRVYTTAWETITSI